MVEEVEVDASKDTGVTIDIVAASLKKSKRPPKSPMKVKALAHFLQYTLIEVKPGKPMSDILVE